MRPSRRVVTETTAGQVLRVPVTVAGSQLFLLPLPASHGAAGGHCAVFHPGLGVDMVRLLGELPELNGGALLTSVGFVSSVRVRAGGEAQAGRRGLGWQLGRGGCVRGRRGGRGACRVRRMKSARRGDREGWPSVARGLASVGGTWASSASRCSPPVSVHLGRGLLPVQNWPLCGRKQLP